MDNYPYLNQEEFTAACHHLDRRYRQATLGPLRRRFRLRLCTALDTQASAMFVNSSVGYATYMQITRPLVAETDAGGLSLDLGRFSFQDGDSLDMDMDMDMDKDMVDAEEADESIVARPEDDGLDIGYVTYEIHLHPTYRVPCLWFNLHGLPAHEEALNIDTVFRHLVPDQLKHDLRKGAGGIGGISLDHHPLTGVPSFFVHPCMLGDAMTGFQCDQKNYLAIWVGLTGGCVGLWIPKEMMYGADPDLEAAAGLG